MRRKDTPERGLSGRETLAIRMGRSQGMASGLAIRAYAGERLEILAERATLTLGPSPSGEGEGEGGWGDGGCQSPG